VELKPIHNKTIADQTAEAIRKRILDGGFRPGERLVEAKIASELGISRGPLREALHKLRAQGLVWEEPRRGNFVLDLDEQDVKEIFDLRAAIETLAIRLVLTARREAAMVELNEAVERIKHAAIDGDLSAAVAADLGFHETLCRVSGNERLHKVFVENATALTLLMKVETSEYYESYEPLWDEHKYLLDAISSYDLERAETACREHLAKGKERLLRSLLGRRERHPPQV
jgi:DNA-binding GntR family transcriptional regulator